MRPGVSWRPASTASAGGFTGAAIVFLDDNFLDNNGNELAKDSCHRGDAYCVNG